MKKSIIPLFLFLAACGGGNSRNELMTRLYNEKKIASDSLRISAGANLDFESKAHEIAHSTHDSLKYAPMLDSASKYYALSRYYRQRDTELQFSIDSLDHIK